MVVNPGTGRDPEHSRNRQLSIGPLGVERSVSAHYCTRTLVGSIGSSAYFLALQGVQRRIASRTSRASAWWHRDRCLGERHQAHLRRASVPLVRSPYRYLPFAIDSEIWITDANVEFSCSVDHRFRLRVTSLSSGDLDALLQYGASPRASEEVSRNWERARG